ncbi:hypothetical protein B4113_2664 [Geobacillus sp. B4113_201601]|nr:hypothetical protein B4113_2664 [Geobacillus sp. B4113_201601]
MGKNFPVLSFLSVEKSGNFLNDVEHSGQRLFRKESMK